MLGDKVSNPMYYYSLNLVLNLLETISEKMRTVLHHHTWFTKIHTTGCPQICCSHFIF